MPLINTFKCRSDFVKNWLHEKNNMGAQYRINSSVGIGMGYCMDGWNSFPGGTKNFSLHHSVQTGSSSRQTPYTMGTASSFAECKSAGA
jgi:hypothetical protein